MRETLVLNASYEPLSTVSLRRAVVLVLRGTAVVEQAHPGLRIRAAEVEVPVPQVIKRSDGTFAWSSDREKSIGKVRSFYGQIGVLVRAYSYIRALGHDGLRDVAEKAVLSANYLGAMLKHRYETPFPPPYAHEFITVPKFPGTEITELDVAKRLIDYGIHPPTMSWPIHHCLMVEPTETESLRTLDEFVTAMLSIADEIEKDPELVRGAPYTTPVKRLDEVTASRKPDVRWRPK